MKWSNFEIEYLIKYYPDSEKERLLISLLPGRSLNAITRKAQSLKIKRKMNKSNIKKVSWSESEDELLRKIWGISTKEEIRSHFPDRKWGNINCRARKTLKLYLRNNSPRILPSQRAENLLKNKPEAYYWCGFLCADGYINSEKGHIRLSITDKLQLGKYANFVNASMNECKTKRKPQHKSVFSVDIKNIKIATQLSKKFDFKHNKTKNPIGLMVLDNMSDDFFLSFFIGFFDGDGHIYCPKNNNYCVLQIECHESWLDNLKYCERRLKEIFKNDIPESEYNRTCTKIGKKGYTKFNLNTKIAKELKKTIIRLKLPILERKWNKFAKDMKLITKKTRSGHSLKTKLKISKKCKGYKLTEETKEKISNANKGRVLNGETKSKISRALKGKPKTEIHKLNLSISLKGITHTEETKEKISKAMEGRKFKSSWKKKISKAKRGIAVPEDRKRKISETLKNNKQSYRHLKDIIMDFSKSVKELSEELGLDKKLIHSARWHWRKSL